MVPSQPAERVLHVPLHHLPAVWRSAPAQGKEARLKTSTAVSCPCNPPLLPEHGSCQRNSHLDSISRFAASAYLKSSLLASSRNLILDNLREV